MVTRGVFRPNPRAAARRRLLRRARTSRSRRRALRRSFRRYLRSAKRHYRRKYFKKLRQRGYQKIRISQFYPLKFANRLVNADRTEKLPQSDSDYATFNILPYPIDIFEHHDEHLQLSTSNGSTAVNDLNVPCQGHFKVLPAFPSSYLLSYLSDQVRILATCYREYRIKTFTLEFSLPEIQQWPEAGNSAVYNNNLWIMFKHTDEIKPPSAYEMAKVLLDGFNPGDQPSRADAVKTIQAVKPLVNAPSLFAIQRDADERFRNMSASGWHKFNLKPGKKYKIKWHPKTYYSANSTGLQPDFYTDLVNNSVQLYSYTNIFQNQRAKPTKLWVDTNSIDAGTVDDRNGSPEDVFWTGPTVLLVDTSHDTLAKYDSPPNLNISSVAQSQFNIQIRLYATIEFRYLNSDIPEFEQVDEFTTAALGHDPLLSDI